MTFVVETSAMEYGGGSKITGIRQIVRLREIIHKWQSVTIGARTSRLKIEESHGSRKSPITNKRITNLISCDSDDESCKTPEPPPDVPKGYLAVYVGPELRRFIIPTSYLSHSLFKLLLEKAAEEFGFDQSGGLTIPCEIETFKYLLKCIEAQEKEEQHDDSLCKLFALLTLS